MMFVYVMYDYTNDRVFPRGFMTEEEAMDARRKFTTTNLSCPEMVEVEEKEVKKNEKREKVGMQPPEKFRKTMVQKTARGYAKAHSR